MFVDFNKAFFNKETKLKMPQEVMTALNEKLPKGFKYAEIDNGVVGLTPESSEVKIGGFKFDTSSEVFGKFKPSNVNEVMEYLYRTQKRYKINVDSDDKLNINGTEFKIEELIDYPYEEKSRGDYSFTVIPQPFQPPFNISLEGNGVKKEFIIERQPFADMQKSLYKSVNDSNFEISYIIDEENLKISFNFNLNIKSANSVIELVEYLTMYYSCMVGEIKLNGEKLPKVQTSSLEGKSMKETISFWEKVLTIEEVLKVNLIPDPQIEFNEVICIEKLFKSIIEKKPFKEYINIDELTIKGVSNDFDIERVVDAEGVSFSFQQSSSMKILGVNIDLNSIVSYFDMKVKSYKCTNEKERNYKLFIEPYKDGKIYQSIMYFINEEESGKYEMDLEEFQNAELIEFN
ncbi:abortive infection system toxin AbiGii family protein [Viridibacillus arvi]|uniref:abortive infection system toxin AbiGii family protein n=1 Tax=Viridibacillus arvi TaxID=263475 RepID=UPI0036952695